MSVCLYVWSYVCMYVCVYPVSPSFDLGQWNLMVRFLLLTRFFRKETNFRQVGIIYGFSNIPVFLNGVIFFINSIPLQIFLIIGTAIFALVCLGSGLKQVYLLRNIEAFLLVIASGFGSSLFSQVI